MLNASHPAFPAQASQRAGTEGVDGKGVWRKRRVCHPAPPACQARCHAPGASLTRDRGTRLRCATTVRCKSRDAPARIYRQDLLRDRKVAKIYTFRTPRRPPATVRACYSCRRYSASLLQLHCFCFVAKKKTNPIQKYVGPVPNSFISVFTTLIDVPEVSVGDTQENFFLSQKFGLMIGTQRTFRCLAGAGASPDAAATAATPATRSSDAHHCAIDALSTPRACGKNRTNWRACRTTERCPS